MPASYHILPVRNLVYVRYVGLVTLADTAKAFGAYAADPARRPGQQQLIDLARVTDWDRDFAGMIGLQAKKAETFHGNGSETLLVYHAPTKQTYSMAQAILRSWDGISSVVTVIQETEAGALGVLGQPEDSFDALLQAVG